LLFVNYRPEYAHGWGNKSYYTRLRIDPLGQEGAEALLDALLGNDPTVGSLKPLLIERTEGNPFFLEESVRSLAETGALVGERGEWLAHHAIHGQVWDRAVAYCRRAGERAIARSANREAAAAMEQALAALAQVRESPATIEQAIDLRLSLRSALVPLGEYGR